MPGRKRGRLPIEAYALRLLRIRPRSRRELEARLLRHGYTPEAVQEVLEKFARAGLVDDAAFARDWVRTRMLRGMGDVAIVKELVGRFRVPEAVAREAVAEVFDEEAAYSRTRELLSRWWERLNRDPRGRRKLYERAWRRGIPSAWVERFLRETAED